MEANQLYLDMQLEKRSRLHVLCYVAKDQIKPIHNKFKQCSYHSEFAFAPSSVKFSLIYCSQTHDHRRAPRQPGTWKSSHAVVVPLYGGQYHVRIQGDLQVVARGCCEESECVVSNLLNTSAYQMFYRYPPVRPCIARRRQLAQQPQEGSIGRD
jgi:hypothetical protein